MRWDRIAVLLFLIATWWGIAEGASSLLNYWRN